MERTSPKLLEVGAGILSESDLCSTTHRSVAPDAHKWRHGSVVLRSGHRVIENTDFGAEMPIRTKYK